MDVHDQSLESAKIEQLQRDTELSALLTMAEKKQMALLTNVPYDGDCFFNSVIKHKPNLCLNSAEMRSATVEYFSSDCPPDLQPFVEDTFLAELKQPHKDVQNDLVMKAIANMYKMQIRVLSYDPVDQSISDTIYGSTTEIQPICIGHIKEKHFVPLTPIETKKSSDKKAKRPSSQATLHSFFKKKKDDSSSSNENNDKVYEPQKAEAVTVSQATKKTEPLKTLYVGSCPNQPKDIIFPKRTFGIKCQRKAQFQPKCFDQFPWLHYDINDDKAFCHICITAYNEGKLATNVLEPTFISKGYTNWKDATEKKRGF